MREYMTEQRKVLIAFLKENTDRQFSVEEICEGVNRGGAHDISISAVYRNIAKLVEGGHVRRFMRDGSRTAVYQYVHCHDCEKHLHMKCVKCSKILHMDDEATSEMLVAALKKSNFKIDERKTMLYGVCDSCSEDM